MMTSGRGYLLRETRWCVERAIDGEWEGKGGEEGERKKKKDDALSMVEK